MSTSDPPPSAEHSRESGPLGAAGRQLPSGTVTFLFTDIEGSTRLLHQLGPGEYADALAEHRRLLRDACERHGGVEVDNQGDALFIAFPTADGAIAAAREGQQALALGPIRVRMGIHTGTPYLTAEGYVGGDVHRAARIAAAGHGGQVLVSASTAALAAPDDLRDLGQHRLKDLTGPERIFQLGAGEHPPLKSLHNTNLPVPTTSFLGREREVDDVAELLGRRDVRLVTLTGPGGTGKTRLALQAAGAAADAFPAGVWWVPLAAIREPGLVLTEAARAMGAPGDLAEHVGDKRMLVLWDNFEQVMDAAPSVGAVLERCPNLTVLVTSREALRVRGEWEYAVEPLREPDAVALFATRAVAARHDFAPNGEIGDICRRLDHLPLAIELAAARVRVMSPRAILERLERRLPLLSSGPRDAPDRQRTLRAALAWSHDLLSQEEQRLFARLSVFRGGWTIEAAEQVADADLDTLQSLVEKSLVRQRDDRFWMLETIREFATEQLDASNESCDLRRRHAGHFLDLAVEAEPHLTGGDPKVWLERLEPDHDNVRAAIDHLQAVGDTQAVLRLVTAFSSYWYVRGFMAEGSRRFADALAAAPEPTEARAGALIAAIPFAFLSGDVPLERRLAEEALELNTRLGNVAGAALARYDLANLLTVDRDWAGARALLETSLAEFIELGDEFNTMGARRGLAWVHQELGDLGRYRELIEENLAHARSVGNRRMESRSLGALAMLALDEGRLEESIEMMTASLEIDRTLGFMVFVSIDLARFAAILLRLDHPEQAAQLLGRADGLRQEHGFTLESWAQEERDAAFAAAQGALDAETFTSAQQRGRLMSIDEAADSAVKWATAT